MDGIHNQYDKNGVWNLYNLVNDADQITNVADQHPDIIQKMKTAYEKYATDVGVIIPRGKAFSCYGWCYSHWSYCTDDTVTIDLAKMFPPGYPIELNPVAPLN